MSHRKNCGRAALPRRPNLHHAPVSRAIGLGLILQSALSGILLLLIQLYRWTLSPVLVFLFGGGTGCRFTPTCSQYAAGAIRQHGALAGGWMGFKRICRCHPLGGCGHDPVPNKGEALLISNG
jgi:hypothetical protein